MRCKIFSIRTLSGHKRIVSILSLFFLLLTGCSKYYVSLREIPVTENSLASVAVATPDPRKENPPIGEEIVIDWVIPPSLLNENPQVILSILYKNHEEESISYPIHYKSSYEVYSILGEKFSRTGGVLSCRARIEDQQGKLFCEWEHQLWVQLIHPEE